MRMRNYLEPDTSVGQTDIRPRVFVMGRRAMSAILLLPRPIRCNKNIPRYHEKSGNKVEVLTSRRGLGWMWKGRRSNPDQTNAYRSDEGIWLIYPQTYAQGSVYGSVD